MGKRALLILAAAAGLLRAEDPKPAVLPAAEHDAAATRIFATQQARIAAFRAADEARTKAAEAEDLERQYVAWEADAKKRLKLDPACRLAFDFTWTCPPAKKP